MENLLELRNEIDAIDKEIVGLFQKRMKISSEVAEYKISTGKKVFDRAREQEKIAGVKALTHNDFNSHGVEELFEQIMSMSRKLQYQLLAQNGVVGRLPFIAVEEIEKSRVRVVFQGVEGAYSEAAMKAFFQDDITSFHVEHWRDAMEAIASGDADYAVLPIENSSAGIVSENYDLMVEYGHCIVGEQIIKIEHALLGVPGAKLSDITDVYSHPQALMQCARYLEGHREWEKHSLKNTAMAAQKVRKDGMRHKAAIASRLTAEIYGLDVLEEGIQDNKQNATRFIIVMGKHVFTRKANKISICFEGAHETGSLYHMLSHLIYNGINMDHIESRPLPERNWEYRFFVDFEGNLNDPAVQNALLGLSEETTRLQILGNYEA